jgi:nucleotide-binding universal stress UspA family protein
MPGGKNVEYHLQCPVRRAIVKSQMGTGDHLRERRRKMYKKILVPLDGSQHSEAVLPHAEALARSEHAELIILRVPITPTTEYFAADPHLSSALRKDIEAEAEQYVHEKVMAIQQEHIPARGLTREGAVPDTIIQVAQETHADLIAMSTHAWTGLKRWVMGSVADEVIHHTHIPVMVIHPNH